MDYPAPDVRVTNGQMDFSNTYGVGVGEWDKFAAIWLYGDLSEEEREAVVQSALDRGLAYVADSDARSIGTAHPLGNVWDNGADPVEGLNEAMKVRRLALDTFGPDRIQPGQPVYDLNKVIVPIYLYHRYQTAAAAKYIGGMSFNYALNGDGQDTVKMVSAADQLRALKAVLATLSPDELDIKDETLELLMPSLVSYSIADSDRELFRRTAYPAFDVTAAADTAADLTFDVLFDPRRAARLIEFKRRDARNLGFMDVLQETRRYVMKQPANDRTGEIAKGIQARFVFALMELADSNATPGVKARTDKVLRDIHADLGAKGSGHGLWLVSLIDAHLERPAIPQTTVTKSKALPPGGPIGQGQMESCWHCEP